MSTSKLTLFLVLSALVIVLAACAPAAAPAAPAQAPAATEAPAATMAPAATQPASRPYGNYGTAATPSVTVSDQAIQDGTVTIAKVVSNGPGWLVVHAQADGKPGPILGYSPVSDGVNTDVKVEIDTSGVTDVLYAMLHTDAGTEGKFEFPGGPDTPVSVDGKIVTPAFKITQGMGAGATVMLGGTDKLGPFLVDHKGMTLYTFGKDKDNQSACYGGCAKKWPPLLVGADETPTLAEGIPGELGVITRDDGGRQVTYNGSPLYYYEKDKKPGDAKGDGAGGVWYVATPSGD